MWGGGGGGGGAVAWRSYRAIPFNEGTSLLRKIIAS